MSDDGPGDGLKAGKAEVRGQAIEWLSACLHAGAGDQELAQGVARALNEMDVARMSLVLAALLDLTSSVIRAVAVLAGADPLELFQEIAMRIAADDDS